MIDEKYRVLILDDDTELGEMLMEFLQNTQQCDVTYVNSVPEFWERLSRSGFDILFLDYRLPNTNGLEILTQLGEAGITIPTVMMTGEGSENIAAKAIQTGALDYLVKGELSLASLPPLIHKAVRLREMQRAMQQYLEQVRFQAMLLDNMRDAVVVWGLDGKISYWNAAAEQLYGVPAGERLGRFVQEVYFPRFDPPIDLPELGQASSLQLEHRCALPNGEKIWISTHITTLYNEGSRDPIGYMNVARDVTPRKLEQEALVKSQHFIQRILDTSPNIIYTLDVWEPRFTFMNAEAQSILGFPAETFTAAPFAVFAGRLHPEDRDAMERHLRDLQNLPEGEVQEVEYRFLNQGDESRWLRARETVFSRREDGLPAEIIGVIQDITASKLADQAMRKSEARYRAIVEDHQTEMICRFLPDSTLTFVNEAYCKYYGQERACLEGTSFLDPLLEQHQHTTRDWLASLSADNPVTTFQHQARLQNGEVRWQEWVGRAIFDPRNDFLEFQAVGRDITERKRMEEQVQAAQTHLTEAARLTSIGALASGVAHQISNPLTTIIADAQLLSQQLDRKHPGQESAEAIVQAGWRAQRVVSELMKFSEPDQARQEPVSVNETIENALLLAGAHIRSTGVKLEVRLTPNLPRITANPRRLTDLWVNLLLLARSACKDESGHEIRVVSTLLDRGTLCVELSDNGTPISPEQYDRIFEPQLLPSGEGRGTGIELSICREIVRQNRGHIFVSGSDSETTFHITFAREG